MATPSQIESVPLRQSVRDLLQLKLTEGEIADWALEAIVDEAVREQMISRNKAATLLGLEDYESREAFFERHGLFNEDTLEMWEVDLKAIKILEARRRGTGAWSLFTGL